MNEISYTVVCKTQTSDLAEEWLDWLLSGHLEDVCAAGALDARVVRLGECHLEASYRFPSREAFLHYENAHAARLRAEGLRLFPPENGFEYTRRVGEIVATYGF